MKEYSKRICSLLTSTDIVKVKILEIITNIKEKTKTTINTHTFLTVLTTNILVSHAIETLPTTIIGQLPNIKKKSKSIRLFKMVNQYNEIASI